MGLLLVNLCLCSWEKSYIALTLYKKRNYQRNPRFYEKAGHAIAFPWNGSPDQLEKSLKKTYTVTGSSGNAFYSQKGLFGRAGATIIHIGLLWTMAAGFYRILSDDFGWGVYDATVILPEGQMSSTYVTRKDRLKEPSGDNLRPKPMPFAVRALDFNAEYFPHSTVAKSFASLVELSDGEFRRIYEVTMTNPVLYKGYKITQNSFSANERIKRGKFRVTDTQTGKFTEADAMPGDPVRLRGLGNSEPLFIQFEALAPDTGYHLLNLRNQEILESGKAVEPETLPLPIDIRPFAAELAQSRYSIMVAALFPNFTFDENNQPTTRDEKFENPAVMAMLFKNGRPNGYTWLFLNPEAQKIVGQPHPEVALTFSNFRKKSDATTSAENLFNYEVGLKVEEKGVNRELGTFWLSPGQIQELQVSEQVLKAANIRMDRLADTHAAMESTGTQTAHTGSTATVVAEADAGTTTAIQTAEDIPASGRYQVEFLGMTTGHVTFLGFMKDPSVGWLFAGCIIIIAGTLIAFMFVYREVWAYYDEESGLLYMATAVRGTSPAAHKEFDRFIGKLRSEQAPSISTDPVTATVSS
jgi:cytochrome c biogenesis protein ResB